MHCINSLPNHNPLFASIMLDSNEDDRGLRRQSHSYSTHSEDERRRRKRDRHVKDHHSAGDRRRPRENRHESEKDDRRRRRTRSPDSHRARHSHNHEDANRPSKRQRSTSQSAPRPHPNPPRSPPLAVSKRSHAPLAPQEKAFNEENGALSQAPEVEKQKPNFSNTGKLAAETNTVAGTNIVLKYNEPPEARKPAARDAWRLYVFKGSEMLETVELGGRSCWLVGRERMVVDFPVDHPSCSKQHAVVQFRHVVKTNEFGDMDGRVRLVELSSDVEGWGLGADGSG